MQRKLLYAGIAIIILSIAIFILSALSTQSLQNSSLQSMKNLTVEPGSFGYIQLYANGTGLNEFLVEASAGSNIFLFNASGFGLWKGNTLASPYNGLPAALSLEGDGTMMVYTATRFAGIPPIAPYEPSYAAAGFNSSNYTIPAGTYDLVVDNINGTAPNANVLNTTVISIYGVNTTATEHIGETLSAEGAAAMLLFVVGAIILIYGILKRNPAEGSKSAITPEEVEELYRGVGSDKYKNKRSAKRYRRGKARAKSN